MGNKKQKWKNRTFLLTVQNNITKDISIASILARSLDEAMHKYFNNPLDWVKKVNNNYKLISYKEINEE